MLDKIHKALVKVPLSRKYQRRLTRGIKKLVNISDPYGELFKIIRRSGASAVLDIGAFHGETVVRFLDEVNVPIHAFEPTPDSFSILKSRFDASGKVILHNCALGAERGKTAFFVNANQQTNSLLDNGVGNIEGFNSATCHVDKVEIEVNTLDEWILDKGIEGPLVIKADVQGAEGMLIEGGVSTFKEKVVALFSEIQILNMYEGQSDFFVINEKMKDLGFSLVELYPCMKDAMGRAVQTDALWVNDKWL